MKNKVKLIIVLILLSLTMFFSYAFPRAKYVGTNFIAGLDVPYAFNEWKGRDVTEQLNINEGNTTFNFINDALANQYVNKEGKPLIFIILDAGNFHHPKVCFTGAGYKIKELADTEFKLSDRSFKAHTLLTERGGKSSLSFYWIVIDGNIAHEWIEQKFKQLYFSLFNKKRIGLMVRIDIPSKEDNIEEAMIMAKQFVKDLGQSLEPKHGKYIFGK